MAEKTFYTEEEIRRRLSISTLAFYGMRPLCADAFRDLSLSGIRQIELLESQEQHDMIDSGSMRRLAATAADFGVHVAAYHAHHTHFNGVETERDRISRVDRCKRQIDTMQELGGAVWGCHAGIPDTWMQRSYEELATYVEGTDTVIAVENFNQDGVDIHARLRFLSDIDHDQVGLILDIGHHRDPDGRNPMTVPGRPTEIFSEIGSRLKHIHLHGFKEDRDHHAPMCDGDQIQWLEVFSGLFDTGYPGLINFEPADERRNPTVLQSVAAMPDRICRLARS